MTITQALKAEIYHTLEFFLEVYKVEDTSAGASW